MAGRTAPLAPDLKHARRDPAQGLPDSAARFQAPAALFGANPESSQVINLWIPGPCEDACPRDDG
jgi:hypothetical protein